MDARVVSKAKLPSRYVTEGPARAPYGDSVAAIGRTLAGNPEHIAWNDSKVRPVSQPIVGTGNVVGFKGNLAPKGAIVKVAGMSELKLISPARCFDLEGFEAVTQRNQREGEVLVTRYQGPRSAPGLREIPSTQPGGAKETHCYAGI